MKKYSIQHNYNFTLKLKSLNRSNIWKKCYSFSFLNFFENTFWVFVIVILNYEISKRDVLYVSLLKWVSKSALCQISSIQRVSGYKEIFSIQKRLPAWSLFAGQEILKYLTTQCVEKNSENKNFNLDSCFCALRNEELRERGTEREENQIWEL